MSVYIGYHAFNKDKADREWARFEELAQRLSKDHKKLEELKRKDNQNRPADEELYGKDIAKRDKLKSINNRGLKMR